MRISKSVQKSEGTKSKGQKGGRNTAKGSSKQKLSASGSQGHSGSKSKGSKKSGT